MCSEMPAEKAGMSLRYVLYRSENMCFSWSEIDTWNSICIQLWNDENYTLAVNNDCMIGCTKLLCIKLNLEHDYGEYECNSNGFWSCK